MNRESISLDALTDIVSNVIGIITLLTLVIALHGTGRTIAIEAPIEFTPIQHPRFYFIHDGRVAEFEFSALAQSFGESWRSGFSSPGKHRIEGTGFEYGFVPGWALAVFVRDSSRWPRVGSLVNEGSLGSAEDVFDTLSSSTHYAYLFVDDSAVSLRAYQRIARYLNIRGIGVGWRPTDTKHPATLCGEPNLKTRCSYLPQQKIFGGP